VQISPQECASPSLSSFCRTPKRKYEIEMEKYQKHCSVIYGQKVDVPKFWKENEKKFPCLSTLAREMLSIAASQTSANEFSPVLPHW